MRQPRDPQLWQITRAVGKAPTWMWLGAAELPSSLQLLGARDLCNSRARSSVSSRAKGARGHKPPWSSLSQPLPPERCLALAKQRKCHSRSSTALKGRDSVTAAFSAKANLACCKTGRESLIQPAWALEIQALSHTQTRRASTSRRINLFCLARRIGHKV